MPDRYDAAEVLAVITRAFENVTDGRNDCGRPDNIAVEAVYLGTTEDVPCPSSKRNRVLTIGFAGLPAGTSADTIALMCPYEWGPGFFAGADILIGKDVRWALASAGCRGQRHMLEATVTHEVGHVLGLDHVSERRHPYLTMSPESNGPCDNEEATLGLGDLLGLERLYGTD